MVQAHLHALFQLLSSFHILLLILANTVKKQTNTHNINYDLYSGYNCT